MTRRYDAIVLGLGGMGSAALLHLADRGRRVLGLEQFGPAHARGSSHGESRIIRKAYFEDPAYVPLILRSYELWADLERRTGRSLFLRTGGLMAGHAGCAVVEGSARSAREHNLPHEWLSAADLRRRFPVARPRDDEVGLLEPDAGILFPEECVLAHVQAAVAAGAEARFGTRVAGWSVAPDGAVEVTTDRGVETADTLVICAGPWLGAVAADLGLPLRVERQVMYWFRPAADPAAFRSDRFPIFILERRGELPSYGFPALRGGDLKIGFHHGGATVTPETVDRVVAPAEIAAMRQSLAGWLPDAAGECTRAVVCLYTNTPDENFVIGLHPDRPSVVLAGGFSGHGFKFCPTVGEILADLATTGATKHPIGLFAPTRLRPAR